MRRTRETRHAAVHGNHGEVMGLMALVIQRSLEKYYALVGIDVEEIRAVLGVILNSVTNLLIDACAKMNMDMMRISAFSKIPSICKTR